MVNALSKHLQVNVYQDGKIYQQEYERGKVLYDLKVIGETERTGTTVRFWPDVKTGETPEPGIFETGDFDFDTLKVRLREMAFLNKGIRISLRDERVEPANERAYHYEGGNPLLCRASEPPQDAAVRPAGVHRGRKERLYRGSALQWNDGYNESVFTFANNIHTPEGGTHLAGLRSALTKVINDYGRKNNILKASDANLSGEDVREGLTAVGLGQTGRAAVRGPDQDQAGQQ